MKAYKIVYGGKEGEITYELGKTFSFYKNGKISYPHPYAEVYLDVLQTRKEIHIDMPKDWQIMEVETLGDIKTDVWSDDTYVSSFIVTDFISREKYPELIGVYINDNGRITQYIDRYGQYNKCQYNDNGKILKHYIYKKEEDYIISYREYKYDDRGNCTHIYDYPDEGNPSVILYIYDEKNNRIKEVFPNGDTYYNEYDKNGNCIKHIYPNGTKTIQKFDNKNRIIKQSYDQGIIKEWTYNDNNDIIQETFTVTDEEYVSIIQYIYNINNKIIQKKSTTWELRQQIKHECTFEQDTFYKYDDNGNQTKKTIGKDIQEVQIV